MYKDIGFHAFSSDCKWDRSPALQYIKRLNETIFVHYSCLTVNEFIANQL